MRSRPSHPMFNGARILIAPLDWGLGHASRCIPIIRRLRELDARPIIGADTGPLAVLRDAFPDLQHVRLPGVQVSYAKGVSQTWAMARQFPTMLRSVREEHQLFLNLSRQLRLDAVISDQRFGIRADGLPSVIVTHQLYPFTPLAQGLLRRINSRHIARFDLCWIPDNEESPGLAGALAHGTHMPRNARFIGPLSRMDPARAIMPDKNYRIVCVISGPEPQRSILERELMRLLPAIPGEHLIVRGMPGPVPDERRGHVRSIGHLADDALTGALLGADLIVGRTGYSTVMDLERIGRTALLVPTPGQPEQEYLGRLHKDNGRFIVQVQGELDIAAALESRVAGTRIPTTRDSGERQLDVAMKELAGLLPGRCSGT